MSSYHITIKIPGFIDRIFSAPVVMMRRVWYGYGFRKIKLVPDKYAKVDPKDYDQLSKYTWWAKSNNGKFIAVRFRVGNNCGRTIYMHREIMFNSKIKNKNTKLWNPDKSGCLFKWIPAFAGMTSWANTKQFQNPKYKNAKQKTKLLVDHINRDSTDNRRANLRLATESQNNMNRSGRRGTSSKYKGVSWYRSRNCWRAMIHVEKKCFFSGYFDNEIEAAKAYDKAAKEHHKEFAYLNFPDEKQKGLRGIFRSIGRMLPGWILKNQ